MPVPFGGHIVAGEVEMRATAIGFLVVHALQQQAQRHPGRPDEELEIRAPVTGATLPPGDCGPERALAAEGAGRDVDARAICRVRGDPRRLAESLGVGSGVAQPGAAELDG
jgi:hypothetical protein